jgi:protocatechuate 3,4-dioxygenase alpha subunit
MTRRGLTPSQTIGPFFAFALTPDAYDSPALVGNDLRTEDAIGQPIRIEGRVLNGAGHPVPDAMVEIWQADGAGHYAGPERNTRFKGFGRSETLDGGKYSFTTVKPGLVPGHAGRPQAPHINVGIFSRGILKRLFTRIYFDDEPANASDPIIALVPEDRRSTLIARRKSPADGLQVYEFDIVLQGENETVFFEA